MSEERLCALSPLPLQVIWHENKSVYLRIAKNRQRLCLRLHRLFEQAPTPVLQALICYALTRDAKSKAVIRQMAHLHFSKTRAHPQPLASRGSTYDLQKIFDEIRDPFPSVASQGVSIGWSIARKRGHFRSITFGTYDSLRRQIRIHPLLDDPDVPLYFLQFIVYHEMLHALFPPTMDRKGRCSIHSAEFRAKERQFPHYFQAKVWGKGSLEFFKARGYRGRP